ncbi:MAG: CoA transferase, partial [Myxococcota bacterium]
LHERVVHEVDGPLDLLRHPVRFSEADTSIPGPPPLAGAHSREILAECGYSEAEIDELVESGAASERTSGDRWNR